MDHLLELVAFVPKYGALGVEDGELGVEQCAGYEFSTKQIMRARRVRFGAV